jgi:hypothetical protein
MFFRASVVLPAISLSLKLRGFRATQEFLRDFAIPSNTESRRRENVTEGEQVALVARMVNAAVRHGWSQSTCLEKSLALWWLLRREAITSSLRIGARKAGGQLEGHAWVERDGVALNEPQQEHRHYATFDPACPLQNSETP